MKTIRFFTILLILTLGTLSSGRAESYIKFMAIANSPSETWTSGKMQRMEMEIPSLGKHTVITRIDKGVSWTINHADKTYTETPLALPYVQGAPPEKKSGQGKAAASDEPGCTAEFKNLGQTRVIAGEKTTGYKVGCKESPEDAITMWMAPLNKTNKKVLEDQKNFSAAYMQSLFANYPPGEKESANALSTFFSSPGENMTGGMACPTIPEGYPMGIESGSIKKGEKFTYEVVKLSAGPNDKSKFEIPAGYTKIDMAASISGMFGKPANSKKDKDKTQEDPLNFKAVLDQIKKQAK